MASSCLRQDNLIPEKVDETLYENQAPLPDSYNQQMNRFPSSCHRREPQAYATSDMLASFLIPSFPQLLSLGYSAWASIYGVPKQYLSEILLAGKGTL